MVPRKPHILSWLAVPVLLLAGLPFSQHTLDIQPKGVGFRSLTDAINTTTAQGRLVFNIFASLA